MFAGLHFDREVIMLCVRSYLRYKLSLRDLVEKDWPAYQGGPNSIHYSQLTQINRNNVKNLKVAWTFDTGDSTSKAKREFESNPLIINGVLYGLSPKVKVFALNAATGKEIWSFDPAAGTKEIGSTRNRGVAFWSHANGKDGRLFVAFRQYLYAIDTRTGSRSSPSKRSPTPRVLSPAKSPLPHSLFPLHLRPSPDRR